MRYVVYFFGGLFVLLILIAIAIGFAAYYFCAEILAKYLCPPLYRFILRRQDESEKRAKAKLDKDTAKRGWAFQECFNQYGGSNSSNQRYDGVVGWVKTFNTNDVL